MNPLNNDILPTISGFLLDYIYRIPIKDNAVKRNDLSVPLLAGALFNSKVCKRIQKMIE
ncbi:hypothetical protein [Lactococcus lactis]|uniref:hypothetical protein n=1 Tax=Lactococcus lactis TaxID=1358 RepID=UPI00223BCDC4|nr:hypothetical protein [Lactococcus lactis]